MQLSVKKTKIGLVQINNSFSGQNYFPYSVGILQAYAERYLCDRDGFEFLLPIYKRIPVAEIKSALSEADIVFFSTYVWNIKISLEIAMRLKYKRPEALMVFGGPQVPGKNTEGFLRKYPFIDIACHGEGENIFLSILENYKPANWNNVPSISYIEDRGRFVQTQPAARISDLSRVPSPYTDGVFDPLIEANPQEQWVGLWETNRGCPFTCAYCVWGGADQNKVYAHEISKLRGEIDWFSKKGIEFIFCCDANFGILERDIDIINYIVKNKRRYTYPMALSTQGTKNFTEHTYQIYKAMFDAGLSKGASLSLQSMNADTLSAARRKNISLEDFRNIQQRLTALNIETFTDLILGLPDETYDTFVDGASSVIESGQHDRIQFNNLSILLNSEMDAPEYQKKYGFDIVETKIINIHGSSLSVQEVYESQRLVVGTSSMPRPDWIKARVFGWMVSLLHFNKLLQIPFIILNNVYSADLRQLTEVFTGANAAVPELSRIRSFFTEKAYDIQNGGTEYIESKKWLNMWWPADELMFITLCAEDKLEEFYKEAGQVLAGYLDSINAAGYEGILKDALLLNQSLIKLPFYSGNADVELSHNIWGLYESVKKGRQAQLKKGSYRYTVDRAASGWQSWEQWCREVVWYGYKRAAYLYNCQNAEALQSAGGHV